MRDQQGRTIIHAIQPPAVDPALRLLAQAILEIQDLSFSADGLETLLRDGEIISASALALDLVFGRMKDHANKDSVRLVVALTAAE